MTLIKEILGSHLVIFICFSTVKAYLECVWYVNVYSLQKSQQGDSSIYHNGLVLGTVSMVSFFLSGFVSKYFDSYKAQFWQGFGCFMLSVFLLVRVLIPKLNEDPFYLQLALYSRYIIQCLLELNFGAYLQSCLEMFPSNLQFMSMEI